MSVAIKAELLTKRLQTEVPVTLIENATLEIRRGEFVVVTGPSGSGKSSLLYLLSLLDKPTSGRLWLHDRETSLRTEDELADMRLSEVGFVFQFHFLLPEFTALENVMLPMQRLARLSAFDIKNRGIELLTSFGLGDQLNKLPKQLSGGQSQRVAIARALANDPSIIFADEPTGNLDTVSSANVQKILKDIAKVKNHAVVVVTHDKSFAQIADRVITVVDGKITD